jgi:exosortase
MMNDLLPGTISLPQAVADTREASPVSRLRTAQKIALGFALVELIALFAPTVGWLYDRWTMSVWHNAHGLLIPPIVGYLIYQELKPLNRLPARSSMWGFAFLVPALLLQAIDAGMQTQLLSAIAIWIALPGLSLLFLGTQRTRAIGFPLLFLAFALPIPLGLTEQLHWQLRQITTAGVSAIVPLFGIPLFVEGTTVHTARGAVLIADACSGFSTLYAAAAVACLTAYSAASTFRRVLVLVAFAPLALAANLVRVAGLVAIVGLQGPDLLETPFHPLSGMMTFVLALPVIFWLGGRADRRRVIRTPEP